MPISHATFAEWLSRYGEAWEARSAEKAVRLFAADAVYHWTPFGEPLRGRAAIEAAYAAAVDRQRDVTFSHAILAADGDRGIAQWHATFTRPGSGTRVDDDGVLVADFDGSGLWTTFREWWHTTDP